MTSSSQPAADHAKRLPLDPVIVSALRTPVGRFGGALSGIRPDDLAALAIREAVAASGVVADEIEDVIFGAANQAGEDNRNVARMSAMLAGLPDSVAGQTVNRLCGSGLQAIVSAGHAIRCGEGDVFVAGGVESMSRAPYVMGKAHSAGDRSQQLQDTVLGWRFPNPALAERFPLESMGETGENVAAGHPTATRERQDAFALESQARWARAQDAGIFADEILPVTVPPARRGAEPTVVASDEHPRPQTTPEGLAKLRPAFRGGGTVTAGNASGINDGAAALVVVSRAYAEAHNLAPLACVRASAVAGVDARVMGLGPIPATRKALSRAGLSVQDLDRVELNEAFAAQALACIDELELDPTRVNVNGGAIAIGHPLGATGARMTTTLIYELARSGGRYGLVTMCIGVGQGIACVIEREG
jgi:3-oxoadipyl-CoA thiolase